MTWLVSNGELTPEQIKAIELNPNRHRLILGAPGSGKTQILLHRARYLIDKSNTQKERYHILVYTNVLKEYIESALHLLNIPAENISTFDHWIKEFHQKHLGRMPWNAQNNLPDFKKGRQEVLSFLQRNAAKHDLFDFILVDEGQDLDSVSFEILKRVSRHLTVCLDHKQQIYNEGSDEKGILSILDIPQSSVNLLEALRCNPFIAQSAAKLIQNTKDRENFVAQVRTQQPRRRETPLLYFAKDFTDERDRLIDIVRTRMHNGESIGILFPKKNMVFGFAQSFRDSGIAVETPNEYQFNSNAPKLLTYHSAKGLTFDTIIMPRLVRGSFNFINDAEQLRKLLFVGMTRARTWFYLSTVETDKIPLLSIFDEAESQHILTKQVFSAIHITTQVVKPFEDDDVLNIF
jgi:superfamily I DNA/RNA helicase